MHQLFAVGVDPLLVVRRLDQAERHRVGGGAGAAEFARQRFHQRDDAGAGGGDDGEAGFADARGIADHADDAAVLAGVEMWCRGVAAMDRAVETGIDLAMPIVRFCFHETLADGEPGIVDQDIQAAEIPDDGFDHRLHGGKVGDVGFVGFGLAALGNDIFDERVPFFSRTAVVHRDVRAFGGKAQRDFAADAARGTGHQRNLSSQIKIHVRSFMVWLAPVPLRSGGTDAPALPAAR